MSKTPISVKIISWIYILIGFLAILSMVFFVWVILVADPSKWSTGVVAPADPIDTLRDALLMILIYLFVGTFSIFLGFGLAKLKKLAWYMNYIFILGQVIYVAYFYSTQVSSVYGNNVKYNFSVIWDLSNNTSVPFYALIIWNSFVIFSTFRNRKRFGL